MTHEHEDTNQYRARAIHVKNEKPLASILDEWASAATRLYNNATFLNRNTITGLILPEADRHPNQQYAIDEIESILPKSKKTRWKSTRKALDKIARETRESIRDGQPEVVEAKKKKGRKKRENTRKALEQSCILNQHHRRANYNELDAYYKYTDHEAYRALPVHAAQNILREVDTAWDNWGKALHDWRTGDSKLSGRPGMPYYKNKKTRKAIQIPAADITIVEEESSRGGSKKRRKRVFAQLPLIRSEERIEITGLAPEGMTLALVQVNPVSGGYDVVFVYKKPSEEVQTVVPNLAGGDLGLDNLLTIVVNDGVTRPLIIDGKELKSINRYWNKKIAELKSQLPHGTYKSKRINACWAKRCAQLHDGMNQAVRIAVRYLVDHQVRELVVGKNDGWKEDFGGKVPTHRKNKQDFVFMPYEYLISRLSDALAEVGVRFVVREESYTSKASLVDGDSIPTYGVDVVPVDGFKFGGCRVSRGCYRSNRTRIGSRGLVLNADVNGAGNILRKECESAFDGVVDWRFVMCPLRVGLHVFSVSCDVSASG